MIYQAKEFTLMNGLKVVLKTPEISDAKKILNQIITVAKSTDYLLSTPEDFKKYIDDISKEEEFIANARSGNNYLICVYANNEIVGNSILNFLPHIKDRHRATVGIAIVPEYQGMGIGSLIFDELIKIARNTPDIEQMELDVIATNEKAKRLYLSKGFVKTGDIPHQLKLEDETYLDGESMVLYL